jgi:hypothetical protein
MASKTAPEKAITISLSEDDVATVRATAARLAGLCVVELDAAMEDYVGRLWVESALPSANTQILDGRVVSPESGSWKIEEIDEQIIVPSNRSPLVCNVIVVQSADSMSVAGRDRLLKTLEEPNARTSFCFLVRDSGALGATILGRASEVRTLHSSDIGARAGLIASGVSESVLNEFGDNWVSSLGLLGALASSTDVETVLCGSSLWGTSSPVSASSGILSIFEGIGKDPISKRRARVLCGAWMVSMTVSVAQALRDGVVGAEVAEMVFARVSAAQENLTYNTPLSLVGAVALSG